jgi:tetratricopeptide (TPR) repeat protein
MAPKEPDAAEWLSRGLSALQGRLYEKAVDAFSQAAALQPQQGNAHYYLALSSLHGNRPRLVSLARIRTIESHLQKATQVDPACGHAFLLWAILKEDYYVMNHIHQPPPTVSQLLQSAGAVEKRHLQEMSTHLRAPGNRLWEWVAQQK